MGKRFRKGERLASHAVPARRIILSLIAITWGLAPARAEAVGAADLVGFWRGTIEAQPNTGDPNPFDTWLTFTPAATTDGVQGTVYFSFWGKTDWPLTDLQVTGAAVECRLVGEAATGRFAMTRAGEQMDGTYTWRDGRYRLTLRRTAERPDHPRRLDLPVPPYPFAVHHVHIESGNVRLHGRLLVPHAGDRHPAVVLLPGGAPETTDPEIPGRPRRTPWLWVWAGRLARSGWVVLQTDGRGLGGSGGNYDESTLDDLTSDALAAHALLRARADVDPAAVGLVGHSQGAAVAALAGAKARDAAFVVMLAGCAQPLGPVIVEADRALYTAGRMDTLPETEPRLRMKVRMFELLAAGVEPGRIADRLSQQFAGEPGMATLAERGRVLELAQIYGTPMRRSAARTDPAPAISALRMPVLAAHGGADYQVAPAQLTRIRDLLKAGGNIDATAVEFPGLDHGFQTGGRELPSDEIVAPAVLDAVDAWLTRRFLAPKAK